MPNPNFVLEEQDVYTNTYNHSKYTSTCTCNTILHYIFDFFLQNSNKLNHWNDFPLFWKVAKSDQACAPMSSNSLSRKKGQFSSLQRKISASWHVFQNLNILYHLFYNTIQLQSQHNSSFFSTKNTNNFKSSLQQLAVTAMEEVWWQLRLKLLAKTQVNNSTKLKHFQTLFTVSTSF